MPPGLREEVCQLVSYEHLIQLVNSIVLPVSSLWQCWPQRLGCGWSILSQVALLILQMTLWWVNLTSVKYHSKRHFYCMGNLSQLCVLYPSLNLPITDCLPLAPVSSCAAVKCASYLCCIWLLTLSGLCNELHKAIVTAKGFLSLG